LKLQNQFNRWSHPYNAHAALLKFALRGKG
jgi:hypothetical protein